MDLTEDVLRQFCVPVLCSFLFVTRLMTNVETRLLVQLLIKFTISFSEQILKLWSFYLFVVVLLWQKLPNLAFSSLGNPTFFL